MITLATPRQSDRSPSVVDTERRCWVMVFSAGGVVRDAEAEEPEAEESAAGVSAGRTCIRV
jgi:hypothetical protein